MGGRGIRQALLLTWFLALCPPGAQALEAGGYLKATLTAHRLDLPSPVGSVGEVWEGWRARLDLRQQWGSWRGEASLEETVSFAPHPGGMATASWIEPPARFLDLERVQTEGHDRQAVLAVDRLWLSGEQGRLRFTAGRQPVGFGAGLFWAPTDVVCPVSPREPDREVRPGSDALRLLWSPDPLAILGAVWAPERGGKGGSLLGHARFPAGPAELFVIGGLVHQRRMLGGSAVGEASGTGLRLEGRVLEERAGKGSRSWAVAVTGGFDRRFQGGTRLAVEALWNGAGAGEPRDYPGLLSREDFRWGLVPFLGRRHLLGRASRQIHPLLEGSLEIHLNLDDGSWLLWPTLGISLADSLTLSLFALLPQGEGLEEHGLSPQSAGVRLTASF